MSVEDIEERILSDARAEAERILSRARGEAALVIEQAKKEANKQAGQLRERMREETARECARILSQSRIEARKIMRSAREKAIKMILAKAEEQLGKIRENPGYPQIFNRLADEGIQLLGQDRVELGVPPSDRPLAEAYIRDRGSVPPVCTLSPRPIMTAGGVVVSTPGNMIKVNNTVEARLARMEREIAAGISRILFDEGGDEGGR